MPQLPATHVAVPCDGIWQGVHEEPQVVGEMLETHSPEQLWNPELQEIPQVPEVQVAAPFVGTGHGEQDIPQERTSVSRAQISEH